MRSIITLCGWLLAVLLWCGELPRFGATTATSVGPPPSSEVELVASPPSDPVCDPEASSEKLAERTRLVLHVAELEGALLGSERRVAEQAAELERHRLGLERAVAELNRRPQVKPAAPPRLGLAARTAVPPARRSTAAEPLPPLVEDAELTVIGDQILIHGTLRNPDREPRVGTLRVELLHDGRVVDVRRGFLEIEPRGEAEYRHRFRYTLLAGTLSARAIFDS